jgi:hypothetical protein
LYNLNTGKRRRFPSQSSTEVIDLNPVSPLREVCSPLRVPSGGSLSFYGKFAIANDQVGNLFLERCGSHVRMPVDELNSVGIRDAIMASDHAVLWPALIGSGFWDTLQVALLPSLRRVTIPIPAKVTQAGGGFTALDSYRLYSINNNGVLWSAPLPSSVRSGRRSARQSATIVRR